MHNIKTIIVDDEPLALSLIKAKLSKHPQINIVAECQNGRKALEKIQQHAPDLVFLDIEMPGLNGFDVIQKIQNDLMPLIVFTTAYDQYALNAFDVNAVDYILKPIDEEHIQRAVERATSRLQNVEDDNQQKSKIIGALQSIKASGEHKIVIKDGDEITLVNQQQIEWIDAAGDYCCIHAQGKTHIKRSTISAMLDELDPSIFKRVHRSTIINLTCIDKVTPLPKGEFYVHIGDNEQVKVSRTYKDVVKDYLQ
ncbi:LytR/AlgR family response regulator transcription factor [Catenovulum sp. SX2]|uniref:LytR/AlgR family response regulator transcription factor n=1 Tax=Catenovulum sp. SX2 TaxID=3398614 RepID=UPI003F868553